MLKHRLLFGFPLFFLVIFLFWLDDYLPSVALMADCACNEEGPLLQGIIFFPLVGLITLLALPEWTHLFRAQQVELSARSLSLPLILILLATQLGAHQPMAIAFPLIAIALALFIRLVTHAKKGSAQGALRVISSEMLILFYLGGLGGILLITRQSHSAIVILAAIMVVKSGDIGAYFAGRAFGRHKLIPWLSPGKTWEGLFGGIILAELVAVGLAIWSQQTATPYDTTYALIGGGVLAIIGHAGDLTISLFKRDAQVKDSGSLLPGFGGILDLIDSPIFAAPAIYLLLEAAKLPPVTS